MFVTAHIASASNSHLYAAAITAVLYVILQARFWYSRRAKRARKGANRQRG